jgi:hypothetical protein
LTTKPTTPSAWQAAPRKAKYIFLAAVFFVFASLGFANDIIDMGRQPLIRFAFGVVLSGLFSVSYAASGIILRKRFWIAFIPVFIVQFVSVGLLNYWFHDLPQPVPMGGDAIGHLHDRLAFDGCGIIIFVTLGYVGFVTVSISEGKRHLRDQMEKASLESEMAAAREVQSMMVPEHLPQIEGYRIESVYRPAAEVGGDFFQVIPLKSGRTLVVIGDVSGKGLRAAMIVAMIVGTLRTVSGYTEEPGEILGELNRRLYGRIQEGFATCLAVRLEEGGRFSLANAGHLPLYVNGAETAFAGSLPLGLEESADYEQGSLEMADGDVMVLLTDGIAEAQNELRVLLGFSRVEGMLRAGASARHVAETAQEHGQNDDITVISVTRAA